MTDSKAYFTRIKKTVDQLITDDRAIFGDQICAILYKSKYLRHSRTGQIEGYGKKLLP